MRNPFFVSIMAVLAVACAKPIEEVDNYGDIAGIVSDKSVGDPISVAQVTLDPSGKSTVTGSDGSFTFTNIKTGDYTVKVNKKGYNDASNKVSVVAGSKSECNLLLERIPAYVTADKDVLDFGDNLTQTTLSFNIVNSSYENLSWHIDYDKSSISFVKEISPASGTTPFGKTSTIVVTIDRDKLKNGPNESTLVIVSDNGEGSSEVKIKAVGKEKTLAALNILSVTDVSSKSAVANGEITFAGLPTYKERGFVYAQSQYPTIESTIQKVTVAVDDKNQFKSSLINLEYGFTYYVRAYAINEVGTAYSTNQIQFTPQAVLPAISVRTVTDLNLTGLTVKLHASIDNAGDPAYTEKGFVYSTVTSTPTLTDGFITVSGSATGSYTATLTKLSLEKTYYVRGYAVSPGGTVYSDATSFSTNEILPVITTDAPTSVDIDNLTAVLHGTITDAGTPAYTERGFVYSTEYEEPTIYDNKIVVSGTGTGSYEYRMTNFSTDKTTYIRAYAKNHKGTVYGETKVLFTPGFLDKGDYIVLGTLGIAVQKIDVGSGGWSSMNSLCENSTVGGYTDWRLPTIDELASLYELKDKIGNFKEGWYWSEKNSSSYYHWRINFRNGAQDSYNYYSEVNARAVRTLTK
ncbi:MAG: DUF1566 domain-containing protein [Bacteroidaceae bacterium]|nr:DUF1566 domain-containing protein [Bacteroidaceae bacterium]